MPSKLLKEEGTPEPHDPSKVEAVVEQDPLVDLPPDYEGDKSFERKPDTTEEDWRLGSPLDREVGCPEDWATREEYNLIIGMTPLLRYRSVIREWFKTVHKRDWYAVLQVNAKNIPGLMRNGFYWSSANVVPGRGFIILNSRDLPERLGLGRTNCNNTRTYKLRGHENTDIEWRGILYVCSKVSSTVTNFDLNWVTRDKVVLAKAYDWNSNPVYFYNVFQHCNNFNVVYEGMPSKGWLP